MCEENDLNKKFKFDFDAPYISAVETAKVKAFLMKDPEPTLIFYGGEPLLQMERIKELIDALGDIPNIKFRMQTNGKLLDKFNIDYLKKIGKILVSIDGTPERTDFNKGEGTYDKVVGNLKKIRSKGYCGEIVARMAVSGFGDIYEQVMHLVGLTRAPVFLGAHPARDHARNKLEDARHVVRSPTQKHVNEEISDANIGPRVFDSIHWQLDVGFYSCDYKYETVKKWLDEYNASIKRLVEWWMDELRWGRMWNLYPFVGVMEHLLSGRKAKLMCGAGHSGYTITTDGNLVACPIMGCMPDFYCGSLDSSPGGLREIGHALRCRECEYLGDCGGRCLYVNSVELWPPEGMDLICSTVKNLIDLLRAHVGEIKELIDKRVISEKDFEYEKYFGPEIVP
jgi:radical SAM protein with 4Fe4S-binding SPASM domain